MSSCLSPLYSIIAIYIILFPTVISIDIENSHSVSQWWYQLILHNTGIYPITNCSVCAYGENKCISCKSEKWPPYPWTCPRPGTQPYILPLTVKLINSLGQEVKLIDVVEAFTGSTRYNTTYSFINSPTTTTTTIKPSYNPTLSPITNKPTLSPNTDPTSSPITSSPTLPTISPTNIPTMVTNTPTTPLTTEKIPDTPFLGSNLKYPHYVGYINTVLCNIGHDLSCLASIGLPGYSRTIPHRYNVLNFGSYIIRNDSVINALEFWFNPRKYLTIDTIEELTGDKTSSNNEIRIILHNIYAKYDIKIFLSTFGEEDDDALDNIDIIDNWLEIKMSAGSIGSKLASIARDYYFDGININFDHYVEYFEQNLIILTESINSALNRNSLNPYFIITHSAPSILFEKSINYPNGGYLMIHEFCDVIMWYNIKYYDSGTITYNTFDTLFISHNTSIDKLILGDNKQKIAINGAQIVIARNADYENINGYLPATIFSNILSEAISRGYPYWKTGFMVYDFYSDEEQEFYYSLELIKAFLPTPEPTLSPIVVTQIQYPTVARYSSDTNDSFDLLNLNSYGWGEWFFLITMFIILAFCCIFVGCCYHRYRVKDRILTDDQIKDLEDDMNRTAISDSWRRLSKLLVRSPSIDKTKKRNTVDTDITTMNEEQATRVLGQSICGNEQDDNDNDDDDIELTDNMMNGMPNSTKSIEQIKEEDLEQLVGRSVDKGIQNNLIAVDEDDDEEDEEEDMFPINITNNGDGYKETNDDTADNTEETEETEDDNSSNKEILEDNHHVYDQRTSNIEGNENITIK